MAKEGHDEYEMIPVSPLRKMEKRLEELERGKKTANLEFMVKEILDMVKSNQNLVDHVIKADAELREELKKLPTKIDEMVTTWKEFIEVLKEASGAVEGGDLGKKFDALLQQNGEMLKTNKEIIVSLESMRRGMKSSPRPPAAPGPRPTGIKEYPRIKIRPRTQEQE